LRQSRIVGDGLTCLIQCMYLQGTHLQRWARIVEDSPGMVGMVSHVSHSVAPPKNTFTPRWARIVEDSPGWLGMVSHVSHSVHVPPRNTFTPKVGQDELRTVQDSWGWSHMSHIRCMYHPRNTFTPKVGQDS
jgi:ribosomal protein L30/L7E